MRAEEEIPLLFLSFVDLRLHSWSKENVKKNVIEVTSKAIALWQKVRVQLIESVAPGSNLYKRGKLTGYGKN